tara:strand:+ start:81 stop:266 length:186 start_codon:yes stop_codon:yes gene_type:complete
LISIKDGTIDSTVTVEDMPYVIEYYPDVFDEFDIRPVFKENCASSTSFYLFDFWYSRSLIE